MQKHAATTVFEQISQWSRCRLRCSFGRSAESGSAYRTVTEIEVAPKVDGKGQSDWPHAVVTRELQDLKMLVALVRVDRAPVRVSYQSQDHCGRVGTSPLHLRRLRRSFRKAVSPIKSWYYCSISRISHAIPLCNQRRLNGLWAWGKVMCLIVCAH